MSQNQPTDPLLAASRLTGADLQFLHLVELIATKRGAPQLSSQEREGIDALHERFRRHCAEIFEHRLGRERALQALTALESAPLHRYLAASQAMAPVLRHQVGELQKRMGNVEI